jgi:hypothetical protein
MLFGYLTLATAIAISVIAAYYSIIGLTAIFAAAFIPVVVMGTSLEIGKVVTAVWLHNNWNRAAFWMKTYLTSATIVLMIITSMGIFGFLSKAHTGQTVASQESVAQVSRLTAEIERYTSVVARAEEQIKKLETSGTGNDANVQAQIDKEQQRIDNAYARIQPAIDEQNKIIGSQAKLYQDELDRIDAGLKTLQGYIDSGDTKKAQQMIGASADGVFGKKTAEKIGDWQTAKQEERKALLTKIEQATNNPQARAAGAEIKRLRLSAEREVAESNKLINRLRTQVGKASTATNIDAQVDEQNARIKNANTEIEKLTQEKYTLEGEYRKLEAEVGPIKYIAALIYGDNNTDSNTLENAVRWVIILLVCVFDPLAIILILAGAQQLSWARKNAEDKRNEEILGQEDEQKGNDDLEVFTKEPPETKDDPTQPGWMYQPHTLDTHPYLSQGFTMPDNWTPTGPIVSAAAGVIVTPVNTAPDASDNTKEDDTKPSFSEGAADSASEKDLQTKVDPAPHEFKIKGFAYPDEDTIKVVEPEVVEPEVVEPEVVENPLVTAVRNYNLPKAPPGKILQTTPLFHAEADNNTTNSGFGSVFPTVNVQKGEIFLRTDYLPSRLFKWNGDKWIEVSKENTSHYAYDVKYIEHIIGKLKSGEYELDDLNETEQDQIEAYLLKNVQ